MGVELPMTSHIRKWYDAHDEYDSSSICGDMLSNKSVRKAVAAGFGEVAVEEYEVGDNMDSVGYRVAASEETINAIWDSTL